MTPKLSAPKSQTRSPKLTLDMDPKLRARTSQLEHRSDPIIERCELSRNHSSRNNLSRLTIGAYN